MSYRCEICSAVSPPRSPMRKHVIMRTNIRGKQEIAQELPICSECAGEIQHLMDLGNSPETSLSIVRGVHREGRPSLTANPSLILKSLPRPEVEPLPLSSPPRILGQGGDNPPAPTKTKSLVGGLPVAGPPQKFNEPKRPARKPPAEPKKPKPKTMELKKPAPKPSVVPVCERCGQPADFGASPVGTVLCEKCAKSSAKGARGRRK